MLYYLFVALRLLSTLLPLPLLTLLYALRIKRRPRPSWSSPQCALLDFNRRVAGLVDIAGMRWEVRDPSAEPSPRELRETSFERVDGLSREELVGVLRDDNVGPTNAVGCFVWERRRNDSVEQLAEGFVGIYAHGGLYLYFSAHDSSATSAIPRYLMKVAVEYRLLPAPFPAALQDVAAVFVRLIQLVVPADRIILIGDSTGGNIMLALARWIRDEGLLRQPAGVLLLSATDPLNSQLPAYSFRTSFKSFKPHPHPKDYLTDHPPAYRHNVQSFLGAHRPHSFLRHPYISPSATPVPDESFKSFPPVFVQYGDAERLEEEIDQLVAAVRQVEASVEVEKTVDGVHDLLILLFWDSGVKKKIYKRIEEWLRELKSSGQG
ncbi:Alpha/Beta hydrolase protein [Leucosporidium creatinivorum]|uniref:Alpha/Beta hydrolase protein n=1 Tax=Leucosporidium creatinivorum TaxID=106004 RepID=A0A1Y2DQX0_9BASI|nr:Alpha/Beta hydrolase protein [Leucosporidium creatinivorum]